MELQKFPSIPAADLAYAFVAERLRRGVFQPGSRISGERGLAAEIGVSRSSLRQALVTLAEQGLLQRSSQRGWFVPRAAVGEPPSVLQSFSEMARSRGLTPTARVLQKAVRPASLPESERLGIAPSAPTLHLSRLRGMNDMPVCLEESVFVADRVQALVTAELENVSLYQALADLCGIVVSRSSYAIQALGATNDEAQLLGLAPGAPVLVGQELTYDFEGVPLITSRTAYRGDAYRFQADLFRPPTQLDNQRRRPT